MSNKGIDHYTAYIKGNLSPAEREEIDQLLLRDEKALASYLKAFEAIEQKEEGIRKQNISETFVFPSLPHQAEFAGRIMNQIDVSIQKEQGKKKSTENQRKSLLYQKLIHNKLLHYTVAASITVLFMSTGVFDRIASGNLNKDRALDLAPYSHSQRWVEKATGWLDSIKPKP